MYKIGEFSKLAKTTVKTLRFYDESGLLKPAFVDPENGYRCYTTEQLVVLHQIMSLRQTGLSISEISGILSGGDQRAVLLNRKAELEAALAGTINQLSRINFLLSHEKEDLFMEYQAIIKKVPECIVYSKQLTVPDYQQYLHIIPEIGAEMAAANPGLACAKPEYCFSVYLDGEFRDTNFRIEFCEAVDRFGTAPEGMTFKKLGAVTVASVMHKGPYTELGKAYAYLMNWIAENGYTPADNPRECHIDGVWNKESEADWLTELQIPVNIK